MTVPTISAEMVGREADLAVVRNAFERAVSGAPSAVLIEGEAGIGKTRLLREIQNEVASQAEIHVGRCLDLGDARAAYGPLIGVLRSVVASLGVTDARAAVGVGSEALRILVPEVGEGVGSRESTSPDALRSAVATLIEAAAVRSPQVIVIEDLHWADDSTLVMLSYLLRTLQQGRILVLATCRSDDVRRGDAVSRFIADTVRARVVERLPLQRLGREATRRLVEQLVRRDVTDAALTRLMDRAEGVPFFIEEMSCCSQGPLPDSLRDMLLVRFDQLDEDARHVVRLASASDGGVPHELLVQLASLSDEALDGAIRSAVENGILSIDADRYSFRHALLREAVHDDLLPGERARLHRAFAEALEEHSYGHRERSALAHHWRLAQMPDRALAAAVSAMYEAKSQFAFATAARFGELALELWEQVPDAAATVDVSHVTLMRQIGSILRNAGEFERALVVADRALGELDERSDPAERARLLRDKGQYLSNLALPGATELFLEALDVIDRSVVDDQLHATLLNALAGKYMLSAMLPEAIVTATRALDVASRVDDPREMSVSHNLRGTCRTYLGYLDDAFDDFREAARLAPLGRGNAELRYYVNFSDVLALLGRHREAFELAEAGIARARELGVERTSGTLILQNVAEPLLTLGDIDGAVSRLDAVPIGRPQVHHDQYVVLTRIRALAWQGRADEGERMREEWLPYLNRTAELERQAWFRIVENDIGLAQARADWTAALDAVIGLTRDRGFVFLHVYRLLLESGWIVGEVRAAGGDVDDAVVAIRRLWDGIPGAVRSDDWAMMLEALLSPSIEGLRIAVDKSAGDDVPAVMRGVTRLELARTLVAAGERGQAQQVLADAAAAAASIGHVPLQRAIAAFGAASGLTPSLRDAAQGSDLTARERQVVELIAEGLSNRQIGERLFISAKTVSVHVSAILRKLDVTTRTEAALIAARP